ncbi:MAG: T9SS type A sorting domain-containing protein [Flavobacteriales bacterium]
MKALLRIGLWLLAFPLLNAVNAQCTNYTITVGGGTFDYEIDWELVNDQGITVASGVAPQTVNVCLPNGCYTMYMYDLFGDGWNGASFVVRVLPGNTIVSSGTLNSGSFGTAQVNLGGGCGGANCSNYTMTVSGGAYPLEVSWNLIQGALIVGTGFAPSSQILCLDTGCFVMQLFDSFGDGWNGATWTLTNSGGSVVGTGTLATGSIGQQVIDLSPTTSCTVSGPVTASDCPQAVNICTNYNWSIDPSGIGTLNEIPPLGSLGNPDLLGSDLLPSAWGTDNWGCLRNNELNSTWMIINISGSGSLEFTFGGLGSQAGFYDWIMYPYNSGTCSAIMSNAVAPVRCNWNGVATGGTGLAATVPPGGDPTNFEPPLNVLAGQQYVICFSNWSSVTTLVPLEFGGTATVSCEPIVLPLELVSFVAEQDRSSMLLHWRTATEQHTDHFVVERSNGDNTWTELGTQPSAGNSSSGILYRFVDRSPPEGHMYYRLRMVDQDGSHTWSPTVHGFFRSLAPAVYPNPASGLFHVRAGQGALQVLDALGRTVRHEITGRQGDAVQVWLPEAAPGCYMIRVGGPDGRVEHVVLR